ncbi:MAG: hypothetical protein M0R33_02630 [Methylomonas sp.]|uniref:hypothetical protein n=1 Tax=Methylomonas sp. TaxID=418 RepID=UPI0025FAE839|nr:hypothetical protein [Methylomonas sp.]MCK9605327.1 hypothetical protein [Methylomonas sp.]
MTFNQCPQQGFLEGRRRTFSYGPILGRDSASADNFWLKQTPSTELNNLPEPEALIAPSLCQAKGAGWFGC